MTSYVALGDSFAAGVGAGRRRAGPYRTDAGYPVEVARRTGLEVGMFLAMPEEHFLLGFGYEHYIEPGREPEMVDGWPF